GGEQIGGSNFGESVSLSSDGNTALIGGNLDGGGLGAAWVFTRSGSTWTQQGPKLTGGGETSGGWFGRSVALSGDASTAVIGGPRDVGSGRKQSRNGAAWMFARSGSTWTQQGPKLTGGGATKKGSFGSSAALSGDGSTTLIGDPSDKMAAGAAWVFTRAGETWSQQGPKLTGSGEKKRGSFG